MGIRNLTQLIRKKSPNSIQTISLYTLKDKKVAIDTSIFLYKSLTNVRYNGDYLKNKEGKIISHIVGLFHKTIQYLTLGITPIYIFDGKPPVEKQNTLDERNKKVQESKELISQTQDPEEKKKLEKGTIRIKKEYIDDLKKLFTLMGVSYIHPNCEAEAYASELCRIGHVDAVVSEDMDTLAFGSPLLIRSCIDRSIKRNDVVSTFDLNQILKDFKMDFHQFIDMCILCGCDYCPTIPKVGNIRAFQYIQTYKSIEKLIESNKCTITQEFLDQYLQARDLFFANQNTVNESEYPMHSSSYDRKTLYDFLVNECDMSSKRVDNSLKKLNKFDTPPN